MNINHKANLSAVSVSLSLLLQMSSSAFLFSDTFIICSSPEGEREKSLLALKSGVCGLLRQLHLRGIVLFAYCFVAEE